MSQKESFALAQGEKDGKPWFAIILEQFRKYQDKEDLPWLLRLDISTCSNDIGLVSNEESDILNKFEDSVEELIGTSTAIRLVARITWNGKRSVFYYVKDPSSVSRLLNEVIDKKDYPREFEYKIEKDERWERMSNIIPNIESF